MTSARDPETAPAPRVPASGRPLRTIVCGTGFGRFYVEALARLPEEFTLAGLLARGGEFSRDYARRLGVPLYTDPDQVPGDVDAVCVVVGSAVSGGPGGELARAFLGRGLPVLQEHPVHPDELAEALRAARRARTVYHLNPFYRHVEPIRRFLAAARTLRGRGPVLFVDATSAIQVLHPLLDVLARALGAPRPWALGDPLPPDPAADRLAAAPQPYRVLQAAVAGAPVTLRVQNQLHPSDGDNHALLWHRLAIGTAEGVLTLADTHGPVLWQPRLYAPRDAHGRLRTSGPGTEHLAEPATTVLAGTEAPPRREVFDRLWPQALARALTDFAADVRAGADPLERGGFDLGVCRLWHETTARLGRPEIVRPDPPTHLGAADLAPAVREEAP
ncbi:Gfo/Idh/MocA family oxidoreductase [Streptomonospora sp. S1-112]|uniref:Gfo/Idh/MocA family oxidoreductase n=1 Tax=Streptomonospora mangrovi TaxID=2883123 RepID=A0A9X3NMN6_9ACTN|nr:Gfo/Idh/MocA family oxidoreductase [Streptomonospora mangrovi]MDA0566297.1 Gfo/Idh/MocA family oxidoreductase [Streptomonospora mangrovi]